MSGSSSSLSSSSSSSSSSDAATSVVSTLTSRKRRLDRTDIAEGDDDDQYDTPSVHLVDTSLLKSFPDMICAICANILYDAVQTDCEHLFCSSCLSQYSGVRGIVYSRLKCPHCRQSVSASGNAPRKLAICNPTLYRMIANIQVRCPVHVANGCTWTGGYSEMESHLQRYCLYQVVPCDWCPIRPPRGDLSKHRELCKRRPTLCEYCKQSLPWSEMSTHVDRDCEHVMVKCETLLEDNNKDNDGFSQTHTRSHSPFSSSSSFSSFSAVSSLSTSGSSTLSSQSSSTSSSSTTTSSTTTSSSSSSSSSSLFHLPPSTTSFKSCSPSSTLLPLSTQPIFQGCGMLFKRRDLKTHRIESCAQRLVECSFSSVGCTTFIPACELKSHESSETQHHLRLLLTLVTTYRDENRKLHSDMKNMLSSMGAGPLSTSSSSSLGTLPLSTLATATSSSSSSSFSYSSSSLLPSSSSSSLLLPSYVACDANTARNTTLWKQWKSSIDLKCFLLGGWSTRKSEPMSTAYIWKGDVSGWTVLPRMIFSRRFASAVKFPGYGQVVVTGGENEKNGTSVHIHETAEYLSNDHIWLKFPSMSIPRCCHSSFVLGDRLYVCGGRSKGLGSIRGRSEQASLDSVEMFQNGKWILCTPMTTGRRLAAVAVCGDSAYVFGGIELVALGANSLSSFERYTKGIGWNHLGFAPFSRRRGHVAITIAKDTPSPKILIMGGHVDNAHSYTDHVDEYSVATDTWRTLPWKLPQKMSLFAAFLSVEGSLLLITGGKPCTGKAWFRSICDDVSFSSSSSSSSSSSVAEWSEAPLNMGVMLDSMAFA